MPRNFTEARNILIEEARKNKRTLTRMMEESSRDWELQEVLFRKYMECQRAADALLEAEERE